MTGCVFSGTHLHQWAEQICLPQLPPEGRNRALSATSYITDAMEGKTRRLTETQHNKTNHNHAWAKDEILTLKQLHLSIKSRLNLFQHGACEDRRSVSICSRLISSPETPLAVVIQRKGVALPTAASSWHSQTVTSPAWHKKPDSYLANK